MHHFFCLLASVAVWERREIRWIYMVFTIKSLFKEIQCTRYELGSCDVDRPHIFDDTRMTCSAKGEAMLEIKTHFTTQWMKRNDYSSEPLCPLPRTHQNIKFKHCYFHLGHMCTCCLLCQEYPLHLGYDGFTTLVWSWGFTCWMELFNFFFFFNGCMWAACMEFILTRTSKVLYVPKFLHKLPALSSCTETKFPDTKKDLCGESREGNNLKLKLISEFGRGSSWPCNCRTWSLALAHVCI